MNNYEYGFITKCAEYGVDLETLLKTAKSFGIGALGIEKQALWGEWERNGALDPNVEYHKSDSSDSKFRKRQVAELEQWRKDAIAMKQRLAARYGEKKALNIMRTHNLIDLEVDEANNRGYFGKTQDSINDPNSAKPVKETVFDYLNKAKPNVFNYKGKAKDNSLNYFDF